MTYLESSEDIIISRERALQELQSHGGDDELKVSFLEEMGFSDTYRAEDVLIWLGY